MMPEEIKTKISEWLKENGLVALLIAVCAVTALVSLLWLPKDNPIEQAAEKEIEVLTGVPVDFTS
jgi:hypothetical protein